MKLFFKFSALVASAILAGATISSCNEGDYIDAAAEEKPEQTGLPTITLAIPADGLTLAVGTTYTIVAEVANSESADFGILWSVDGQEVSTSTSMTFEATAVGTYKVEIDTRNSDGTDSRQFDIHVVEHLPYELNFPSQSLTAPSTTRYTFPGRPVVLKPWMSGLTDPAFAWTVDGKAVSADGQTFVFTPSGPGQYIVAVTATDSSASGTASASVKVVCVDSSEDQRYRAATGSSKAKCTAVFEYAPAPGQFINDTNFGGMTAPILTMADACAWALDRLDNGYFVSLGAYGGTVTVGFDHSIQASGATQYDFAVGGNAFESTVSRRGSNEAGIVWVSQDVNGNGLPDDEWYELRGSEDDQPTTLRDYAVTYYRPTGSGMNVLWTDSQGESGQVDYLSFVHPQPSYWPAWIDMESMTRRGTRLRDRTFNDGRYWSCSPMEWGYADNYGSDVLPSSGDAASGEGQRNGMRISNARMADGSLIALKYIDFIKVQTGVNAKMGGMGEISTEVTSVEDLNL